jgi:S1-C subfamily serine protease
MASGPVTAGQIAPGSIAPSPGAHGGPPAAPGGYPYPAAQPPLAGRRPWVLPALVVVLLVLVAVQAALLVALNGKLNRANHAAAADRAANAKHLADLDKRTSMLEKQAAASLDPQAVAAAVLPSVFKVDADRFSGTAFVIKTGDSGTTLLTNYHVVAQLYESSGRTVSLEHDSQRFNARIVKVSPDDDLAMLQSTDKFPALTAVTEDVAQGAPVVVVGAPLGLAQSVTTGVVSAIRNDVPGEDGRTYIQFSAPINSGNSGGPVVNAQKQVVGIATAKAQDAEGIGLAIPISVACKDFGVC